MFDLAGKKHDLINHADQYDRNRDHIRGIIQKERDFKAAAEERSLKRAEMIKQRQETMKLEKKRRDEQEERERTKETLAL